MLRFTRSSQSLPYDNNTVDYVVLPQGRSTTLAIGRLLRSHRWVRPNESC
ncbi:hypothetical protein JOF56_008561 [Kibdelosporangium banguiense]|uniref:Uncharacterized protein n=1 Tax=Kibdelosporangium banguiense TaxID=1365924 RepID=A0ABS4TUU9_9PSEU|nr:hypothetical protein [Kibdelosporangium banguiense]